MAASERHATHPGRLLRRSVRLAQLLTQYPLTATGESHVLAGSLLSSGRSASRADAASFPLAVRNRRSRDRRLIGQGCAHLKLAMRAARLSAMHLEAAIARRTRLGADFRGDRLGHGCRALPTISMRRLPSPSRKGRRKVDTPRRVARHRGIAALWLLICRPRRWPAETWPSRAGPIRLCDGPGPAKDERRGMSPYRVETPRDRR
jgi:hypothetical protein